MAADFKVPGTRPTPAVFADEPKRVTATSPSYPLHCPPGSKVKKTQQLHRRTITSDYATIAYNHV